MLVFTKCAAQRNDLRFGIQFSNFEDQVQPTLEFDGLDTCPVIDRDLVFSNKYDLYLEGEAFPLPESVKTSFVSIDLMDFCDGAKQGVSRVDFEDGDSLSCIGRIRLSDQFDSYLIRHISKKQWTKVIKIYMVNVKSNKPLSIIGLSQYAIGSGFSLRIYTIQYKNNRFIQKSESYASDVIELNRRKIKADKGHSFTIDDNGIIKVL